MSPLITVIGCAGGPLSGHAAAAVASARCVAGAERHLAAITLPRGADIIRIGGACPQVGGPLAARPGGSGPAAASLGDASAVKAAPGGAGRGGAAASGTGTAHAGPGEARGGSNGASAFEGAVAAIAAHPGPVAVLASGDPGFFGIVRALAARGAATKVIPAVSSVTLAFARLGLPWDDALVLSAHGRDARRALAAALGCAKAAILTAPGRASGPQRFIPALLAAGRSVYVAECLGTPRERITQVAAAPPGEAAAPGEFADPNIVLALDETGGADLSGAAPPPRWIAGHPGAPDGWALPEDTFAHRDSMITKAEVRAFILARLGPGPGRTIWDIGSGCGSVAVECARFGAHAIAIEADRAQCAHIRANAAAHGVRLQVAEGAAPGVFAGLLPADAAFAGGGGEPVIAAAAAARPSRLVVALAAVDRVRAARDLLASHGYQVDGTALQAARLAGLPGGSLRLAAANPVFVLWGNLP